MNIVEWWRKYRKDTWTQGVIGPSALVRRPGSRRTPNVTLFIEDGGGILQALLVPGADWGSPECDEERGLFDTWYDALKASYVPGKPFVITEPAGWCVKVVRVLPKKCHCCCHSHQAGVPQ